MASAASDECSSCGDDSDDGDDRDDGYVDDESTYFELCSDAADVTDEGPAFDDHAAGSSVSGDAEDMSATQSTNVGGRPPAVEMDSDVLAWLCAEGYSNDEIARYFGTTVNAVNKKKGRLGLRNSTVTLPPQEVLQAVWADNPRTSTLKVSTALGVSTGRLRRHFRTIGFSPPEPDGFEAVEKALLELLEDVDCRKVGVPFALARLQSERGIVARPAHVHRVLSAYDPEGHRKRKQEAAKTQYVYNVAGPRSLYHADAHEKLAKIWGIWLHLLIDGYSRYIIYLYVAPNKLASTVRAKFREACDQVGWGARVRWDKGTENAGAICEQLLHHQQNGSERWKGCAITGRSAQNCRAEYIWNFVKRHVSGPYRELFFRMMRDLCVLDPSSPTDLFCLHAVFIPRVQAACDRFRQMWNYHRIRGPRTVRGHGGGVPIELWNDPVEERVRHDDAMYLQHQGNIDADGVNRDDSCSYGVAEPFKGDTIELTEQELKVEDPIQGTSPSAAFLRALRCTYFEVVTFEWDKEGISEYIEYKMLCHQLLLLFQEGWVTDSNIDWTGFASSESSDATTARIRAVLADLGKRSAQP
mmetsp:Transcript_3201/g.6927  ORF Transcript_3201/g.6927 Transcript_3201/m.6927 type:complete len:584 (-) Transcript_3201:110-1861(-)